MTAQQPKHQINHFSSSHLFNDILHEARSLRIPDGQAEEIASQTLQYIKDWMKNRSEITSEDIRRLSTKKLKILHPELAYIYSNHDNII